MTITCPECHNDHPKVDNCIFCKGTGTVTFEFAKEYYEKHLRLLKKTEKELREMGYDL